MKQICFSFLFLFYSDLLFPADFQINLDSSDGSTFFLILSKTAQQLLSVDSQGNTVIPYGISISSSASVTDGTIRYTGTDFEGRKSGSWVSLTKDGTGADHGLLTGLSDDDHSQYHNNTRGDDRYFQKTEFLVVSAGAGDSGKPVKLDAGGKIDDSMLLDSDIDHGSITGLSDDDHVQYLKVDGTRSLSGNWDIGDTLYIAADKIRARDNAGLYLQDDGGNGLFVKDGGNVGINNTNPGEKLHVSGAVTLGNASGTADGTVRWTGTDFEVRKSGAWVSLTSGGGGEDFIMMVDSKTTGTDGGTFTAGSWQVRNLNSETADTGSYCALNTGTGEFTLAAGTYLCHARAPANTVGNHKARLYNVSDSAVVSYGTNALAATTGATYGTSCSMICTVFTISGTKTFRIEHRCQTTKATDGLGIKTNSTENQVYTEVMLWRF